MTRQDKDDSTRILALLADVVEQDQTPEEAETELVAEGVNLTAFLARVQRAVQEKQKEERLAWRREASRNADAFIETQDMSATYANMSRNALIVEAQKYTDNLHFKNFDEATEDDLRSQLADRARLEQLAKNK